MDCADVGKTLDESNDASRDCGLDAFPLDWAYFQLTVVEEAFVDVVEREAMHPVASDVVVVMHPTISAVGHTFCLMDLLSSMRMTPAVVSYAVIVDALKLDDHVRRPQQQLQTMQMRMNGVVNAKDFLWLNCSAVVMENL